MDVDEVRELLPLMAVGALTEHEREEAEAMIGNRPELRDELDEWRSVTARLAESERRDPPVSLRARVLAAVADVAQESPEADPALPALDAPDARPRTFEPPTAPVVPITSARSRRSWVLAAAAAAVVAVGGAALLIGPLSGSETTDQVAAIVEDDDATTVDLAGSLGALRVTYVEDDGPSVLTADELPAPEADRVYELWTIAEGDDPQRVDIFRPDDDGSVELLVSEMDLDGTTIAITEEPAGGSDVPTGDILAVSS